MYVGAALLVAVNVLNIALISLLFVTAHLRKIPRHPVVSTILWTAIPRSLVAALPAFQYHEMRTHLPWKTEDRQLEIQGSALARFCAAQGMLMYYFLAAQAFFAICFTVPMLMIAIQSSKLWKAKTRVRLPFPYLLSVSPFVWALPTIFLAVPVLLDAARRGHPAIYFTPMGYCTIDSYLYQLVAACLIGIPLVVGVVLAVLIFAFVLRFYTTHSGVPRRGRVVDAGLMLRFSIVLLIIYLDAIITLCEICLDDRLLGGVWKFDLYWTTFTPTVEFILFASQPVFLRTWRAWVLSLFPSCQRSRREQETSTPTPPRAPPIEKASSRSSAEELHELDEEDEELEWSSDEDPYGRAQRRRKRKRQSSLFQWQRPVSTANPEAPEIPPEIHIHPCDVSGHASEELGGRRDASATGAISDAHSHSRNSGQDSSQDVQPPSLSRPSGSFARSGRSGKASPNQTFPPTLPHAPRLLERTDSRISTTSSTHLYGRPMDYMYGEMHAFMGMVALPRPRRRHRGPSLSYARPSAVEMHAAARIQPDPAVFHTGERRGSNASGRSRSGRRPGPPGLYSYDQDAKPKSLRAVNESLFELPTTSLPAHQEDPWPGTVSEPRPGSSGDPSL